MKKVPHKVVEKREKEFYSHWNGANAEAIDHQRKKEKYEKQKRSTSKNSKKQWEVDPKQPGIERSPEPREKIESEAGPAKRERRGWGVPRPNPADQQHKTQQSAEEHNRSPKKGDFDQIPDYSDKSEEVGSRENVGSKEDISKEEEDNEDIRNFITTMKSTDIHLLRQSLKEDEVKKAMQEVQQKIDNVERKIKMKQQANEIEEEITEDIDENAKDEDIETNKSSTRVESSYYAGKPISVRKARPISATYNHFSNSRNEPILSGIPTQEKRFEEKKQGEIRASITKESKPEHNFSGHSVPKPSQQDEQAPKGADTLLKRIEGLDENKKLLLETILDKIEKGEVNKDILLGLEFLNIKKNAKGPEPEDSKKRNDVKKGDQGRDRRNPPTRQELILPSNVESKITKITQKSKVQEEYQHNKKSDAEYIEEVMSPIKEEDMIVEKITPSKDDEIKEIIAAESPGRNALVDSLEQKQFSTKLQNDKKYYSNAEKIQLPENLQKIQPSVKKEFESVNDLKIPDSKPIPTGEHHIQLRIMSTWGNISNAGLTEIQVFDEEGNKLELKPAGFHLRNCGLTSIKNIGKIIDGVIYTTEEDHMWLCAMPAPPTTPEISLTVKSDKGIGAFRIWNFNKSLIDSIKGIKELEIIHNRSIVWFGIVNRGPGNEFELYHTEVILKQGLVLPPVEIPSMYNTVFENEHTEADRNIRKASNDKNDPSLDKPIWLLDTGSLLKANYPITTTFESQPIKGNLGRKDYERSAPALAYEKLEQESSKSLLDKIQDQSQEFKLEGFGNDRNKFEIPDSKRSAETEGNTERNKTSSRVKNHPKINSPFKDILDDKVLGKKPDEKTPKALGEKENVQSNNKKDDNSSINSVEFFNITNFGRLKPAKRESLMQVLNLQQDVIEKVRDVQRRLDFRASPIREEGDILSKFDKGTKEEQPQPKPKLPPQKGTPASAGLYNQKEEILPKKVSSIQTKGVPDSLDSIITKGNSSTKANIAEPSSQQSKPAGRGLYENKSVKIPELPKGRIIKFSIYSTWGDVYYVGLNGIELFNEKGDPITLNDVHSQIRANPPDINCLPGYGKDPRTVDKLVDGTYLTCDDLHVWLAPFTMGKEHIIEIDFKEVKTISMIRIWNYNKSRIHSYRGVRDVAIQLDGAPIFFGEVAKAPGSLKGAEDTCEYILFTENELILSKIDRNDWLNRIPKNDPEKEGLNQTVERPMTGTKRFDENDLRQIQDVLTGPGGRPLTMAKLATDNNKIREQIEKNKRELKRLEEQEIVRQEKEKANVNKALSIISSTSSYAEIKCKSVVINILKTWGDPFYVGLTGLELYDGEGNKIPIQMKNLNAKPRDMNAIPGYTGDTRTLDKLINNVNVTTKDDNMWLIPFTANQSHSLYINLDEAKTISGIRLWNYNKGEEGSFRGSKYITVSADGILITPPSGVLLKKAPGTDYYDFSQFIPLPFFDGWDEPTVKIYKSITPEPMQGFLIQEYDPPELPTGFLFKIKLLSSWGDFNYIGLNGIEFYDHFGEPMLTRNQKDYKLAAEPSSVSCLPGHETDVRTIDKLVNGQNETYDDRNMWLTPFLLERRDEGTYKADHNEIVVAFDKPRIISCINFWNYSKTPERGVREFEIFCDDVIIYRGYLRIASSERETQGGDMSLKTSVLFTKNRNIIQRISPEIYTENGLPQRVILNNEKKVVNPAESRPQTQVTMERPTTSVKGLMNY